MKFLRKMIVATLVIVIACKRSVISWGGWVLSALAFIYMLHTMLYGLNYYAGSLADDIRMEVAQYTLEELGEPMLGREGHRGNSWELLDYGTIVVHVFTEEAREFYSLERLWADAENVDISDIIIPEN